MLEDQLIRDLNKTLTDLTGEVGAVKSTLIQYERRIENINREVATLNKNINKNNITLARATGFVGGISFITSIVTIKGIQYLKLM